MHLLLFALAYNDLFSGVKMPEFKKIETASSHYSRKWFVKDPEQKQFPKGAIVFFHNDVTNHVAIVVGHNQQQVPMIIHAAYEPKKNIASVRKDLLRANINGQSMCYIVATPQHFDAQTIDLLVDIAEKTLQTQMPYHIEGLSNIENRIMSWKLNNTNQIIKKQKKTLRKEFKKGSHDEHDAGFQTPIAKKAQLDMMGKTYSPLKKKGVTCAELILLLLHMLEVEKKEMLPEQYADFVRGSRKHGYNEHRPEKIIPSTLLDPTYSTSSIIQSFEYPFHSKWMDPATLLDILRHDDDEDGTKKWGIECYFNLNRQPLDRYFNQPSQIPENISQILAYLGVTLAYQPTMVRTVKLSGIKDALSPYSPITNLMLFEVICNEIKEQMEEVIYKQTIPKIISMFQETISSKTTPTRKRQKQTHS